MELASDRLPGYRYRQYQQFAIPAGPRGNCDAAGVHALALVVLLNIDASITGFRDLYSECMWGMSKKYIIFQVSFPHIY
jgi:hypothetical protein